MINKVFFKKEIKESVRTSRIIILGAVFLFFAIIGPLTAKYMNELLASLSPELPIVLPDPTVSDAWVQLYSNLTSIGLLIYLIMATSLVAREKSKGSVFLVLTKKVSRVQFILTKFVAFSIIYVVIYGAYIGIGALYSWVLFGEVLYVGMVSSIVLLLMQGFLFCALGLFLSVLSKSTAAGAVFGFVAYAGLSILNLFRGYEQWNPVGAQTLVLSFLVEYNATHFWINMGVVGLITIGILTWSILLFQKQEL